MQITNIKTFLVQGRDRPDRNYAFVKVYIDEGLTALGEAGINLKELALKGLIDTYAPILRGMDPSCIEHICLEAPELVEVPRSLRRADGRSIYQRHGGVRYATRAQLAMEERMVAHADADGAPRVGRAHAALGADLSRLEDALAGRPQDVREMHDQPAQAGLREDQAAAALAALTDGRLVSVLKCTGRVRQDTGAGRRRADLG